MSSAFEFIARFRKGGDSGVPFRRPRARNIAAREGIFINDRGEMPIHSLRNIRGIGVDAARGNSPKRVPSVRVMAKNTVTAPRPASDDIATTAREFPQAPIEFAAAQTLIGKSRVGFRSGFTT